MLAIADSLDEGIKWNEIGIELAEKSKDERSKGWFGAFIIIPAGIIMTKRIFKKL